MSNFIDMTGQQCGELTILYRNFDIQKQKKSSTCYWHCKCSCGKEVDVSGISLRNGHTKSCGHLAKQTQKHALNIEIGTQFGRLTVLKKEEIPKSKNSLWRCKCECGNECVVTGYCLVSGMTKSCGCLQKENRHKRAKDITGQVFGKLTAIKQLDREEGKTFKWLCKCECGNECIVPLDYLMQGTKNSCGCMKNISRGELAIKNVLDNYHIKYEREKIFDTCKMNSSHTLRFDFYLPDYNTIIEFDGEQHFHFKGGWHSTIEDYTAACDRDDYKNLWCKQNNIILKRIPYTDIKLISFETLMSDKFIMKEDYYEQNYRELY